MADTVEKGLSNAMELANDTSSSSVPSNQSSIVVSQKFDRNFLRRFRLILGILFPSITSLPVALFGLLLLMCFLEEFVTYNVGLVPSKYYEVLGARPRDIGAFQAVAITSIAWVFCQAILRSTKKFTSTVSYVTWRQLLCRSLHSLYFRDNNFYDLNVLSRKIDNPDQRITQDVDKLCDSMGKVFTKVIIAPFIIGYYSYKAFANTGWYGPFGIFVLFVVSTLVNKAIMSPTVQLVFEQEKKEGDFRFKHMQIRSNAESLAFLGTALVESWRVDKKLDELLKVLVKRTNWQYLLDCAVSVFDYSGSIVSYLMLAIPIFAGRYDDLSSSELSGLISQNAFVCIYLAYSFSSLADLAPEIVNIAGNAHRVAELLEVLKNPVEGHWDTGGSKKSGTDTLGGGYAAEVSSSVEDIIKSPLNSESVEFPAFEVKNVTVRSPLCGTDLIRDLNLKLSLGLNVLITGPSSCGKSSLSRCLRGLWPPLASHGLSGNPPSIRVFLPSSEKFMMFVPQKPFFTDGTMRQQVIYPLTDESAELSGIEEELNSRVMKCLEKVDLKSLVLRLGGVAAEAGWNWYDVLSPGEMQRLCCARVLFHSPRFVFFDEITSAISQDLEEIIYEEFRRVGITFVSVGHRSSLRQFHDVELKLDGLGGWELLQISKGSSE